MSLQQQYTQYNASQHPNQSDDEYDPETDPMFAPLPPQIREKTEDEREEQKPALYFRKPKKLKIHLNYYPLIHAVLSAKNSVRDPRHNSRC